MDNINTELYFQFFMVCTALAFTFGASLLFSAQPVIKSVKHSWIVWIIPIGLALYPDFITSLISVGLLIIGYFILPKFSKQSN